MNDQPAETTPPPPWTVTGAFQCQTCGTPYRSALAALNCCPMLPSPWTVWDCGQEHPQGRLHFTSQDASECIERNRKAESGE